MGEFGFGVYWRYHNYPCDLPNWNIKFVSIAFQTIIERNQIRKWIQKNPANGPGSFIERDVSGLLSYRNNLILVDDVNDMFVFRRIFSIF